MRLEGVSPDPVTFLCILKTLEGRESMDKGREMHAEVVKRGFERTFFVANNIVHLYLKFGLPDEAREVLDKMPERNVVSWTALIRGYVEENLMVQALCCFEAMYYEGISPDDITFACILKACGNIGDAGKGQEIHEEITSRGLLEKDIAIGTSLVDMYAKCGALVHAQKLFDDLTLRDVV